MSESLLLHIFLGISQATIQSRCDIWVISESDVSVISDPMLGFKKFAQHIQHWVSNIALILDTNMIHLNPI